MDVSQRGGKHGVKGVIGYTGFWSVEQTKQLYKTDAILFSFLLIPKVLTVYRALPIQRLSGISCCQSREAYCKLEFDRSTAQALWRHE